MGNDLQTVLLLYSAFPCIFRFFGLTSSDTVTTLVQSLLASFLPSLSVVPAFFSNTDDTGNVLLFVSSGKLVIYNQNQTPVADVDEGHFVLLPAEKSFIAIAITSTRLILMHAGPLSEMITDDPEWNPDRPVILPICPSLAKTLYIIEYYQNEKRSELN